MFEAFLMSGQADPIDFLFKIIAIQKTQINNTLSGIKLIFRRIAIILLRYRIMSFLTALSLSLIIAFEATLTPHSVFVNITV